MSYAVLTGDLINSTTLSREALNQALSRIETAVATIALWQTGLQTGFARRGGDAWQAVIGDSRFDLRAALFIAASLRDMGVSSRIAIAISTDPLDPADSAALNAAYGPAFTASGRLVADLSEALPIGHAEGGLPHALTILAAQISGQWTGAQARAVAQMIGPEHRTQSEVAKRLGISRPAVSQALQAAGYPAIDAALTAYENR